MMRKNLFLVLKFALPVNDSEFVVWRSWREWAVF